MKTLTIPQLNELLAKPNKLIKGKIYNIDEYNGDVEYIKSSRVGVAYFKPTKNTATNFYKTRGLIGFPLSFSQRFTPMTIKNKLIAALTVIAVIITLALMFPAVVHNISNDLICKR